MDSLKFVNNTKVARPLAALALLLLCVDLGNGQSATISGASGQSGFVVSSRVYDVLPVAPRGNREISLDGQWDLAQAPQALTAETGDISGLRWKPVRMPATIQYALFQAKAIEDPWYGDNWKKLRWIQDTDWYLRRRFEVPANWRGRHIRLRFDGMDYIGAVWLDGRLLGVHEGMFGGPTFDVSGISLGHEHELLVRLIHEKDSAETDSWNIPPSRAMKPAALDGQSYMWATRFRTIGLWKSVRLVSSGNAYMEAPWVNTNRISNGDASLLAQVTIVNTGSPFQGTIQATILDSGGKIAWHLSTTQLVPAGTSHWEEFFALRNPQLWWPNGMGRQRLYRIELSLTSGLEKEDAIGSRFGIRTVELRRNRYFRNDPHANSGLPSWLTDPAILAGPHGGKLWKRHDTEWPWQSDNLLEDDALYNSDESARYLFVINGRPIYMKGICWLTSNDLLAITPGRESWFIRAARLAGINLFRLNGGNDGFETEEFYGLCDEAGILVWQEFPLTWARGSAVPLTTWREQTKESVLRIRQHPSLALYVGGNEFNPYVDALAPYLGIARETVAEYDDRPFRMASPGQSDFHAYSTPSGSFDDLWIGDPNWYVRYYGLNASFIGEWSLSAFTNLSALRRFIPSEELQETSVGFDINKFIETHPTMVDHFPEGARALPLINRKLSWYDDLAKASIAEYVELSQSAQADVYGYVFEQWRAQFPYKGGETAWTFNPPTASSGWQVIDWFGQPQSSYYSIKRADEPIHVMADTNFFTWGPGSMFHASVFAVNDYSEALSGAQVTARILDRQMETVVSEHWTLVVPPDGMKSSAREVRWQIPSETPDSYFFLELTMNSADGRRLSRRVYWLRVLKSLAHPSILAKWQSAAAAEPLCTHGPWLKAQVEQIPTSVSARVVSSQIIGPDLELSVEVTNTGSSPAYPVQVNVTPDRYSALWSDNNFWLAAHETVILKGTVRLDMTALDPTAQTPIALPSDLHLSVSAWNASLSTFTSSATTSPEIRTTSRDDWSPGLFHDPSDSR